MSRRLADRLSTAQARAGQYQKELQQAREELQQMVPAQVCTCHVVAMSQQCSEMGMLEASRLNTGCLSTSND